MIGYCIGIAFNVAIVVYVVAICWVHYRDTRRGERLYGLDPRGYSTAPRREDDS